MLGIKRTQKLTSSLVRGMLFSSYYFTAPKNWMELWFNSSKNAGKKAIKSSIPESHYVLAPNIYYNPTRGVRPGYPLASLSNEVFLDALVDNIYKDRSVISFLKVINKTHILQETESGLCHIPDEDLKFLDRVAGFAITPEENKQRIRDLIAEHVTEDLPEVDSSSKFTLS
ncbi:MAG: hypothetical protein P1U74_03995 [Legionellaceae bacterium]|nr:hypothetical protein [Legionellaceae bacterium]